MSKHQTTKSVALWQSKQWKAPINSGAMLCAVITISQWAFWNDLTTPFSRLPHSNERLEGETASQTGYIQGGWSASEATCGTPATKTN